MVTLKWEGSLLCINAFCLEDFAFHPMILIFSFSEKNHFLVFKYLKIHKFQIISERNEFCFIFYKLY